MLSETDKRCIDCECYDEKTRFCRLNPPTPLVSVGRDPRDQRIFSKYPVVVYPEKDWCSKFEPRIMKG